MEGFLSVAYEIVKWGVLPMGLVAIGYIARWAEEGDEE